MKKVLVVFAALLALSVTANAQGLFQFSLSQVGNVVTVYATPTAAIPSVTLQGLELFIEYPYSQDGYVTIGAPVVSSYLPGVTMPTPKRNPGAPNTTTSSPVTENGVSYTSMYFGPSSLATSAMAYAAGVQIEFFHFTVSGVTKASNFHMRADNVQGTSGYTSIYDSQGAYWTPTDGSVAPFVGGTKVGGTGSTDWTSNSIILPIVLSGFTGTASGCTATLNWQSSLEQNSSFYAVEHSIDGTTFVEAGKIPSKNIYTGASYGYNYDNLSSGNNFFRLRMVDLDGKFTYSRVVSVTGSGACGDGLAVKVSPNPTTNLLNVTGLSTGSKLSLFNTDGKKMTEITATGTSQTMYLDMYAKGVYNLRVQSVSGVTNTVRVVKL